MSGEFVCENCGLTFDSEEEFDHHICEQEPSEEILEELSEEPKDETEDKPHFEYGRGIFKYKDCEGGYKQVLRCVEENYPEEVEQFKKLASKYGDEDTLTALALSGALGSKKRTRRTREVGEDLNEFALTEAYEDALENMTEGVCPVCKKQIPHRLSALDSYNKLLKGSPTWKKFLDMIPKEEGMSGQPKNPSEWSEKEISEGGTIFNDQINKEYETGIQGFTKKVFETIPVVVHHIKNSHSPKLAKDFFELWYGKYANVTNETGEPMNPQGTGNKEQCSTAEEALEKLSQGTLEKEDLANLSAEEKSKLYLWYFAQRRN